MELSDKKLNTFQKGIWQKIFSLAVYGVCIVAVTYAIDRLIQHDINNALASLQKKADISEQSLHMWRTSLLKEDLRLPASLSSAPFC